MTEYRNGDRTALVSSCRIEEGPAHDRVHVWNRGGKAGVLTVEKGDGMAVVLRLLDGIALTRTPTGPAEGES